MCTAMVLMTMAVTSVPATAESGKAKGKQGARHGKLDRELNDRANRLGWTRAIITLNPGVATTDVKKLGGRHLKNLRLINGMVVELPNGVLKKLAERPEILRIDYDRPTQSHLAQVANVVGARAVQASYGLTGAGVGVAVIDSGIANWHDDLTYTGSNPGVRVVGNQRVAAFVDFVNGATQPYDDNGHGTHVSGIIAGSGADSNYGTRRGIAPAAHIVSLKVLDAQGRGVISDVISAFDWAVTNRLTHNIRVINLSVGAAVTTSYNDDPLTLAAKRAVESGIVVVAASGNLGRAANGGAQYGGITAPGNAPWVLTVGATNHNGTLRRNDDTVALYSSRGPTAIDHAAKPDIVAPGTGIVSLASRNSTMYISKATGLVKGNVVGYKAYLTLSGTSMAAPVVAGSVALMIQANPSLTPNLVKAILQYTAQMQPGVDYMTQGGGFLNTKGAVDLARFFAQTSHGARYPYDRSWARKINWGNRRLGKGAISPNRNAWDLSTVWGSATDSDGDNVVWGTGCEDSFCRNVVWGTFDDGENVVWGTADSEGDNVVWGTFDDGDNVVWGTVSFDLGDNVVWGTFDGDSENVVWGTACGGEDCENVVWGTFDLGENVVWGTADDGDNVVWGTSGDIPLDVWASSDEVENVLWDQSNETVVVETGEGFDLMFEQEPPPAPPAELTPVVIIGSGI